MSTAERMRARLRAVNLATVLLHGMAAVRVGRGLPHIVAPAPEPPEYVDARTEARQICRNLGLDVDNEHWDGATVGDFVRLAYAHGWKACESRINSPDVAGDIAIAIQTPEAVLGYGGKNGIGWQVAAVQRVVAYGVPKDKAAAVANVMTADVPKPGGGVVLGPIGGGGS